MVATTADGARVTARTAARGRDYQCPYCNSDMTVAGGEATQYKKYFRHVGESCHEYADSNETEAHLEGKSAIEETLQQKEYALTVETESETERGVPDVRFNTADGDYCVELQVSHISLRDMRSRLKDRTSSGLHTLWLFHPDTYDKRVVSENHNEYVEFKTAEMAYINTVCGSDVPDSVWLPYHDTTTGNLGVAHKISVFDDGGGGWVDATRRFNTVTGTTLQSGIKIATPEFAEPAAVGDPGQARLF